MHKLAAAFFAFATAADANAVPREAGVNDLGVGGVANGTAHDELLVTSYKLLVRRHFQATPPSWQGGYLTTLKIDSYNPTN